MFEEEEETFGVMKKGGNFPQWAIWTIVAVSVVVIVGIAVGVTLALSGGGETNKVPVITTFTAVPPVVSPGGYSTITCVASDPEGKTVNYAWTATGGTISGIGNIVSWIAPNLAGIFSIGITVSDGEGGVTNSSISVAVSGSTPTPTHTSTPTPTPTPTSTSVPTSTAVTYGAISINSTPSGATIYIDGMEDSNVTPYTMIHVTAGNHSVKLVYPGYYHKTEEVMVYSGLTTDINWVLYTVYDYDQCSSQDTYVNSNDPSASYGGDAALSVAGNVTRTFVQFDPISIPSTAVIISANLSLFYYDNESTATSGPVGVYRVTDSWTEGTINWSTSLGISSLISTITVPAAAGAGAFLTWNISSLAQVWVHTPSANYGLMLRDTNEASLEGYKLFYSRDGAHCPTINISYYDPAAP